MENEVRLGIIGLGNMGQFYARAILDGEVPGLKLTAVCDMDKDRVSAFEGVEPFTDTDELLKSGVVDAVHIATPHYFHTTLGIAALEAGLHVLVDKPVSVHKADCERLNAAHTNKDLVFCGMFNQRTDPHYLKLKSLIDNGELGEIRRIQWTVTDWFRTEAYYGSGAWRATWKGEGGGVLLNQCPHQLDLWQWLFGMPAEIYSQCDLGRFHDIEVEDAVTALMRYDNGTTGVFISTTGESPGVNRLEIACERGLVLLEDNEIRWTRNEVESSVFSQESDQGFAKPDSWNVEIPVDGNGEQHMGVFKNFTQAILKGEDLFCPAEDGIHSVELANAILYSGLKHEPIKLPLDSAEYEACLNKLIEESTHVKKVVETKVETNMSASFQKK
ncbi:MAG: Gfo/Idh/MocA family oxidoreductase [Opitutales bacterium]|nr:Gfo/Idh/MocA family oxidoreductase [Opitutales bacterium]MDG2169808.1 Gfo/Idh/MocA family oxidoreductase [Opitutales bacterium]